MCTALRNAPHDGGEGGGTVPALPTRRVREEDDSEASGALQRGSYQGQKDVRRAEA